MKNELCDDYYSKLLFKTHRFNKVSSHFLISLWMSDSDKSHVELEDFLVNCTRICVHCGGRNSYILFEFAVTRNNELTLET